MNCGFMAAGEEVDERTGCVQILMEWERIQYLE